MQFIKTLLTEIREVAKNDLAINREIYDKVGDAIKMLDEPTPAPVESKGLQPKAEESKTGVPIKPTREWLNTQHHLYLKRAYNVQGDKSMTKEQIIEEILKIAS